VKEGTQVTVVFNGKNLKAKIETISDIADENLNYKTTVKLEAPLERLGNLVDVIIKVQSKNATVPLSVIKIGAAGET